MAYPLLFRIASGEVFGPETPVVLRLLEIETAMAALEGVAMELDDSALPLLADVVCTSDRDTAFDGTSWALLIGAMPRRQGMERGDLLAANAGIFGPIGAALSRRAAENVRILVVGNPCNTNALIARAQAPGIPDDRWHAMTRLDENRAKAQLAKKAGVPVAQVSNVTIWGNHSATQYPDASHARIAGRPAPEVIDDHAWMRDEFIDTVQKRGAAIIAARGHSSAASAAHAVVDSVRALHAGTPEGDWTSMAVLSRGEYGVPDGLAFSFPVRSDGQKWHVIEGLEHDGEARERLRVTTQELLDERAMIADLHVE